MTKETDQLIVNTQTIHELIKTGKRLDGRSLTDYREPITVQTEVSWTAEGSAMVQIGETKVIVGVKLSLEKPYADTADQGGIMINAELLPLSSPIYNPGPPGMKAIVMARVLDRGIRESHAIDLKKLCITPGEKAWFVIMDIVSVNDDGNLFDAAGLALLAALKTARFPTVKEDGSLDYKNKTEEKLPLLKQPISITVLKINGALVIDPTAEEEFSADARLTVAVDVNGTISAMQKGGDATLTLEDVDGMVGLALEKADFLRGKLE